MDVEKAIEASFSGLPIPQVWDTWWQDWFFWFDDWLKQGKVIEVTGEVDICHLGVARKARVCNAVTQAGWNIRGHRSRFFHVLYDRIQNTPVPHGSKGSDVVLWKHSDDVYKPSFSTARTWNQIWEKKNVVFWSKGVWFSQGVPRFSFIVWLAVRNRLSTGDRMRTWGIQQGCPLYGERDETRDHLFFACPFSFTVWDTLANRLTGNI